MGWAKKRKTTKCRWGQCVLVMRAIFRMCRFVCFTGSISWKWKSATLTASRKVGYALGCRVRARSVQTILLQRCPLRKIWEIKSYNEYDHIAFYAFQYIPIIFSGSPSECWLHTCRACVAVTSYQVKPPKSYGARRTTFEGQNTPKLCYYASFTWYIVNTRFIPLRAMESSNCVLCIPFSFSGSPNKAATYVLCMRSSNLEIRIAGSSRLRQQPGD